MPKDCQMKDCNWYNAENYPHDDPNLHKQSLVFIPPPKCETCCRFHGDNYSPDRAGVVYGPK